MFHFALVFIYFFLLEETKISLLKNQIKAKSNGGKKEAERREWLVDESVQKRNYKSSQVGKGENTKLWK